MTKQNQIFPDYLNKDADFSEEDVVQSPHIVRVRCQDDLSSLDLEGTAETPGSASGSTPQGAPALNEDSRAARASQPVADNSEQPRTAGDAHITDESYDSLHNDGQGVGDVSGSPAAQAELTEHLDENESTQGVASRTRSRKVARASVNWIWESIVDYDGGEVLIAADRSLG